MSVRTEMCCVPILGSHAETQVGSATTGTNQDAAVRMSRHRNAAPAETMEESDLDEPNRLDIGDSADGSGMAIGDNEGA